MDIGILLYKMYIYFKASVRKHFWRFHGSFKILSVCGTNLFICFKCYSIMTDRNICEPMLNKLLAKLWRNHGTICSCS